MIPKVSPTRGAQTAVVVLCAAAVKLYYSTAGVNQLRWILAPTTVLVELVSGSRFEFESHAGYINSDRSFLIAPSCAGVNFLIAAFLMLALRKLWRDPSSKTAWRFIPGAAVCAYLTTLVANTVRISTALLLHDMHPGPDWLSPSQLHRLQGVLIYFGFLLLLFMVSEKLGSDNASSSENTSGPLRLPLCPLLIYYATTLGIPLANGAYHQGADFWEHSLFVLLTPLLLILPLATFRLYRERRTPWHRPRPNSTLMRCGVEGRLARTVVRLRVTFNSTSFEI
jgi:exosortase K